MTRRVLILGRSSLPQFSRSERLKERQLGVNLREGNMLGAAYITTSRMAKPPLTFICSGASPEWRLNMAMLLQAIYEQDEKLCLVDGNTLRRPATQKRLSENARKYVASDEFTEMCNIVGVDVSFMRSLAPDKARIAYSKLMDQQLSGLKTGDTGLTIGDTNADSCSRFHTNCGKCS